MPAMQITEPSDQENNAAPSQNQAGRLLALDLGTKRVGVAVSDELQITITTLASITRKSWKDLLSKVKAIIESYYVAGLVVGLPIRLDGSEGNAAAATREIADKFRRSLALPIYLQNESLTTVEAESHLKARGKKIDEIARENDSEAAAIILRDFLATQHKPDVES